MDLSDAENGSMREESFWIVWAGCSDDSEKPKTWANQIKAKRHVEVYFFDVISRNNDVPFQTELMANYWIDLKDSFFAYIDSESTEKCRELFEAVKNPAPMFDKYSANFSDAGLLEQLRKLQEECSKFSRYVYVSSERSEDYGIAFLFDNDSDPGGKFRKCLNSYRCSNRRDEHDTERREEANSQTLSTASATVEDREPQHQFDEDDVYEQHQDDVSLPDDFSRKRDYYDNQVMMGSSILERVKTIYKTYHEIEDLSKQFDDVDFRIYTPRFNMLQKQTMARVCDFDAGVLPSSMTNTGERHKYVIKRVRKYRFHVTDENEHEELQRTVQSKPKTLFVIVADECHWGITPGDKAHNRLINDWNDQHKNVIVLQVSATPYNILTQNSRLPIVSYRPPAVGLAELDVESRSPSQSLVCGKQELHLAHWSEVDMARLQTGASFKLKTCLPCSSEHGENSGEVFWIQLATSSTESYLSTCTEKDATPFFSEGLGKGFVKIFAVVENDSRRQLYVEKPKWRSSPRILALPKGDFELSGEAQASSAGPDADKFEIILDFGVGLVAIRSCINVSSYISVPHRGGPITVEVVDTINRRKTKSIEKNSILQLVQLLSAKTFRHHNKTKTYLSLNYYFNTMDEDQSSIRQDKYFQSLCNRERRLKSNVNDLLAADYAYNLLLVSSAKVCLDSSSLETAVNDHSKRFEELIKSFQVSLDKEKERRAIDRTTFDSVISHIRKKVVDDMKDSLKKFRKANRSRSQAQNPFASNSKLLDDFASSLAAVYLHLSLQSVDLQQVARQPEFKEALTLLRQKMQSDNWFKDYWDHILQETETAQIMLDLVESSRNQGIDQLQGRMKIVRVHEVEDGKKFCETLELAVEKTKSVNKTSFMVLGDFGGEKLEKQVPHKYPDTYELLQNCKCRYIDSNLEECQCSKYKTGATSRSEKTFKCRECRHFHWIIDQYESLDKLPCILILVEKGRMGDTFPHSFNCLDLRLVRDGSSKRLSTLVQELGRLCRYVDNEDTVVPYVLLGEHLYGKLKRHRDTSQCSLFTLNVSPDSYMQSSYRSFPEVSKDGTGSLRWTTYIAKNSFDVENDLRQKDLRHKNRLLLQAEPQIGKTGAYLYFIQRLRKTVCKPEQETMSVDEYCEEGPDHTDVLPTLPKTTDASTWLFPYWKDMKEMKSTTNPVTSGKYKFYDKIKGLPLTQQIAKILKEFSLPSVEAYHDIEPAVFSSTRKSDNVPVPATRKQNGLQTVLLRAHCYGHNNACTECGCEAGSLPDPQLVPRSKCEDLPCIGKLQVSIPTTEAFQRLNLQGHFCSENSEASMTSLTWGDLNNKMMPGLRHWIIHPSYDRAQKACLNYNHVMRSMSGDYAYIQMVVVRRCDFKLYVRYWGKTHMIVELPDSLQLPEKIRDIENFPNDQCTADKGGVGYSRLFIQLFAKALKLDKVFVLDDNIRLIKAFDDEHPPQTAQDFRGKRGWNDIPFSDCFSHVEQQACENSRLPSVLYRKNFEPHRDYNEGMFSYCGPFSSYAALGFQKGHRSLQPFQKTQVYSAILLNVKEVTGREVYYRPIPYCEDITFNKECDKVGLWLCKYCRFVVWKAQFKDWQRGMSLCTWDDITILNCPVAPDDPLVHKEPRKVVEFVKYLVRDRLLVHEPLFRGYDEILKTTYQIFWKREHRFSEERYTSDGSNYVIIPWFFKFSKKCEQQSLVFLLGEDICRLRPFAKRFIGLLPATMLFDLHLTSKNTIRSFITEAQGCDTTNIEVASLPNPESNPNAVVVVVWSCDSSRLCAEVMDRSHDDYESPALQSSSNDIECADWQGITDTEALRVVDASMSSEHDTGLKAVKEEICHSIPLLPTAATDETVAVQDETEFSTEHRGSKISGESSEETTTSSKKRKKTKQTRLPFGKY